ncbi:hypothetical protein [Dyella subtropica]|uniref:hypothetical protein n=1 Tax=Dyella subtropica TaxID=2992127 RepID=UPI002257420F|nr:hypothetical protein [Dyella subtropica]
MRDFAGKPKTNRPIAPVRPMLSDRASGGEHPTPHWQPAIANHAAQPVQAANAEHVESGVPTIGAAGFGRDVTQIPIDPPIQPEMAEATSEPSGPMVKLPKSSFTHPVAAELNQPGVRFRLPEFDRVKAAYTDKDLKIPEAVIKARVTQLLERMEKERRLKSKDPVPTIVAKIFPAPGKIDEKEFDNAIDVADRSKIYKSVTDADTKVLAVDKPKLQWAMKEAAADIKTVEGDAAGLTQVFGTKSATAKANYVGARAALEDLSKSAAKVDAEVTTDYNLDDPEVGLGGWAINSTKQMHLLLKIAKVDDLHETKSTLIHEASHFANASVDDHVYYADPGFFELDEDKKVANAAHYEELPQRLYKTSKFDGKTFTPGKAAGGGALTREDKVKAATDLFLRKAWDAGVDVHTLIRGVRRAYLAGNHKPFDDNKALILEISKLMDLTVHTQAAGKAIVTTLDVTLSESVSRSVSRIWGLAAKVPFPSPVGALSDTDLRDKIIADAVVKEGALLKDPVRDKALLDWLMAHYKAIPGP